MSRSAFLVWQASRLLYIYIDLKEREKALEFIQVDVYYMLGSIYIYRKEVHDISDFLACMKELLVRTH